MNAQRKSDLSAIFCADMIHAQLNGRKTKTRRYAWRDSKFGLQDYASEQLEDMELRGWKVEPVGDLFRVEKPTVWQSVKRGDLIWVRETWQGGNSSDGPQLSYRATPDYFKIDAWDGPDFGIGPSFNYDRCPGTNFSHWLGDVLHDDGPWRSPIHMPRWASRITLEVTAAKIEQLQDISAEDAIAEGIIEYMTVAEVRDCGGLEWGEIPADAAGDAMFYIADYDRKKPDDADRAVTLDPREAFKALWIELHGKDSWDANPDVVVPTFKVHKFNIDKLRDAA